MNQITNKNKNPQPYQWGKALYDVEGYIEGDYDEELRLELNLKSEIPCLDVALDGGFGKGLYVIVASEQKPKLALITQFAEAFVKQDYGVLYITPEKSLTLLPSFIISRQSLLFDFPNEKPIDEIIPFSSSIWGCLSKKVQEQVQLLTKNMGVIDSNNLKTGALKARIEAMLSNHDKFVCFVDCSTTNQDEILLFLQKYRQLAKGLEIPIVVYQKVPIEDTKEPSRLGCWRDKISPFVDYSILLKRNSSNGNPVSIFNEKDHLDWVLYECHIMPSYSAPELRKCFLSYYSKFGLFHEA